MQPNRQSGYLHKQCRQTDSLHSPTDSNGTQINGLDSHTDGLNSQIDYPDAEKDNADYHN